MQAVFNTPVGANGVGNQLWIGFERRDVKPRLARLDACILSMRTASLSSTERRFFHSGWRSASHAASSARRRRSSTRPCPQPSMVRSTRASSSLRRDSTRSRSGQRRRRRCGRPQFAHATRHSRRDPCGRSQVALPAPLNPRHQPDRTGIRTAAAPAAKGPPTNRRGDTEKTGDLIDPFTARDGAN